MSNLLGSALIAVQSGNYRALGSARYPFVQNYSDTYTTGLQGLDVEDLESWCADQSKLASRKR
jgi:hypothetical protein